jgi:hypothetical protein
VSHLNPRRCKVLKLTETANSVALLIRTGHPASNHGVEDLRVGLSPFSLEQLKLLATLYGAHPCKHRSNGMQLLAAFMMHSAHPCACRSGAAACATLYGAHPCARMHLLIRRPPLHAKFRGVGYRRESRHLTAIILIVIFVEWAEKAGGGVGGGGGGGGAAAIRQNTSLHCPSSECTGIYLPPPPRPSPNSRGQKYELSKRMGNPVLHDSRK